MLINTLKSGNNDNISIIKISTDSILIYIQNPRFSVGAVSENFYLWAGLAFGFDI